MPDSVRTADTIEEAGAAVIATYPIHLALPLSAVVFERLTLPATNADELGGMVRLQLEKTLPYPPEDIASEFEIISQSDTESVVLGIGASRPHLEALCEPLRLQARLPEKITVFALHVAARCPKGQVVFLVYREEEKLVLAICDDGKLAYTQVLPDDDADAVVAELPQMILRAELDGVRTTFTSLCLDRACADLLGPIGNFFGLPVEMISLDELTPEPRGNLLPPAWEQERQRLLGKVRLRSRLISGAIAYVALLFLAMVYLFWLGHRKNLLDEEVKRSQPQIDFVQTRQARWNALSGAVDPSRYTVELLYQIFKSMPSDEIRLTLFDQTSDQFTIEGEAPSANLAVEFIEKLRTNSELTSFKFEAGAPSILPNEHAQFRVFGKL